MAAARSASSPPYPRLVLIADSLATFDTWAGSAGPVTCVPTMGALHEGHASLVRAAAALGRPVVVTIFVNPTQFNDPADFARYPKTLDADANLCRAAGAACVLVPSVAEVYPEGWTAGIPALPDVATQPGLEDQARPGHFAGVCQVVRRLFEMTRPVAAVFGEKDWQQLRVVTAMVRDLHLGIEIVPSPTIREPDGLAMSSRNRFLTAAERPRAAAVHAALAAGQAASTPDAAEAAMARVLVGAGLAVEYAVVRDAETLMRRRGTRHRALIAARLGAIRLIDNAAWPGAPR